MKLKSYNILFCIFSFLSDRTNGASFFVKYKLLLGTLIIGMAAPSKAQEIVNKQDTLCYKQVANEKVVLKSDTLIEVSGKVIDENGEPLIGVMVYKKKFTKNTINGTVTEKKGKFSINVKPDDVLVFSDLTYETQEVFVSEIVNGKVNIILKSDASVIACYVALPSYHRQKKEKITNIEPKTKKNRKK